MKVGLLVPKSLKTGNVARDLVYGCWCKGKRIAGLSFPPLSTIMVGTVLQANGHEVILVDAQAEELSLAQVIERFADRDLAILLTSTTTLNEDCDYLLRLKEGCPNLKTVAFGGHVTAESSTALSDPSRRGAIDFVVRREPEYIVRDLAAALERKDGSWREVPGLAYLDEDGQVVIGPDYPLIENLDELPIPNRRLLPKAHYFNPVVSRYPFTTMFTSRGCPGRCSFCASPYFYGRVERAQSAERVLAEIEECLRLGYREIFFRDESFTTIRERVMKICQGILSKNLDVTWICSSRVSRVDRELFQTMKKAGCHMVRMGVESGVQELLNNVRKGIRLEQTERAFALARESGLRTHAHLMVGLPGETEETLERTLAFVKKLRPTVATFGILTAYPGTPLFEELRSRMPQIGDGTQMDLSVLHTQAFYNQVFCDLEPEQLAGAVKRMYRSFYLRPSYIAHRLGELSSWGRTKQYCKAGLNVVSFSLSGDK